MSEENDWKEKYLKDTRTTKELVDLTLNEEDYDSDARWEFVWALRERGNREVFEAAKQLCESTKTKEKALGSDILAQLGVPDKPFLEESLPILFKILEEVTDASLLQSATVALGHLNDIRAIEHLVRLKNHPSEDVRYGVVHGLLFHEDERAISALIELSDDKDEDVRDWATFGLGQVNVDTPEIREALFQRLGEKGSDTCGDIRGEALVGLAKRKDERVVEPLLKELERKDAGVLIIEAAQEFADPRLLPALFRLKEIWANNEDIPDYERTYLEDTILACQSKTE